MAYATLWLAVYVREAVIVVDHSSDCASTLAGASASSRARAAGPAGRASEERTGATTIGRRPWRRVLEGAVIVLLEPEGRASGKGGAGTGPRQRGA